ncbi:MAG: TonB-dependent receptor [Deltaproteobacteria bacterium]|nr:TonB-dependent receptor [Deltaproteobacteria bacterium]
MENLLGRFCQKSLLGILAMVVFLSGQAIAEEAISEEETSTDWILEEVTVTAQKVEQKAIEVPISMTVLSAHAIEETHSMGLEDIATQTPNLSFMDTDDMKMSTPKIRGMYGNATSAGGIDQPTAVYVDEIYLNSSVAQQFNLYDVERIEVLRGPQGTLFGRNTVAGVISVHTKKATEEFGGYIEASYGDYNAMRFRGSISGPIMKDRLYGKVAGVFFDREGYEKNSFTGGDLNAKHNWGLRGDLRFEATESVTLSLLADYRKVDQDGRAMDTGGYNQDPSTAFFGLTGPGMLYQGSAINNLLAMIMPGYTFGGLAQIDADPNDRKILIDFTGKEELDAWGVALNVDVALKNMAFKSISSYRTHDFFQSYDVDATEVDFTHQGSPESVDAFMQEFRLTSTGNDKFDWITGLFYYHQESLSEYDAEIKDIFSPELAPFGNAFNILFGGALTGAPFGITHTEGKVTLDSYAAFVHGTYHVNDKLDIALGGRYTYEEKDIAYSQSSPLGNILVGLEAFPLQLNSDSWDAFTPKAVVDYSFTPDIHTYASVAKGFKSGGFSDYLGSLPDQSFEQEITWNYEIGLKASLLDRRIYFSAAAFWLEWFDQQGTLRLPPKESGAAVVDVLKEATIGDIETKGVEIEILALPMQGLTVSAGLGILDSEYTDVTEEAALQEGLQKGDKVSAVPDWSLNFGAKYNFSLGDFAHAFVGVNGEYRDDLLIAGPTPNVEAVQKGYALINAQIGILSVTDRWRVIFWAKNIGDEDYITYQRGSEIDSLVFQALYNRLGAPRTFGVDVRYNF